VDAGNTEADLDAALETFRRDPARYERASRNNAINAMRAFDWSYRWREMLRIVGMEPTPRLMQRAKQLNQLAAMAEHESVSRKT
jgi:hypothetical protein